LSIAAFCAAVGASLAGAFAGIGLIGHAKLVGAIVGGFTGIALAIAVPSGIVYYYRRNQKLTEEEQTSLEKDIVSSIEDQIKDLGKSQEQLLKESEYIKKKIGELSKLVPHKHVLNN